MTSNARPRPSMDLAAWYPLLAETEVPTPRTVVVPAPGDLLDVLDGKAPAGYQAFLDRLSTAAVEIGYPLFLRTGHGSGKHQWSETCHVTAAQDLDRHVASLIEWSVLVDLAGLPTDTWVVREMLPVEAPFIAFSGMPVAKERRYFTNPDGQVVGHHPYWPPDALVGARPRTRAGALLADDVWRQHLADLNTEDAAEVAELTALTRQVAAAVPGAWSVDWLWSPGRGWICIDLAHAERSYIWEDHPNAPTVTG